MHMCHSTPKRFSCKVSSQGSYTIKKYLGVSLQFNSRVIFLMNFLMERMHPESEKCIFDPRKRSSIKKFTSSNKPLKLKVHNKV